MKKYVNFAIIIIMLLLALPSWGSQFIIGALSPHHDVAGIIIDRLYQRIQDLNHNPKRIIIIGPDHFHRARKNIVIGASDWEGISGDVYGASLVRMTRQDNVALNDHCVKEHIPRVKRFFNGALFLSVIVRKSATDMQILYACRALEKLIKQEGGIIILSMDLSHYKPKVESDAEDDKSLDAFCNFRLSELNHADIDCPRGAKLFLMLMKNLGLTRVQLLERSNSNDYFVNFQSNRTTGHATVLFTN